MNGLEDGYTRLMRLNGGFIKRSLGGVPVVAQWLTNLTSIHEDTGRPLASLGGIRIWGCCELWYRLQMWLRSCVAVAVV